MHIKYQHRSLVALLLSYLRKKLKRSSLSYAPSDSGLALFIFLLVHCFNDVLADELV
jgi:hypothetical protein